MDNRPPAAVLSRDATPTTPIPIASAGKVTRAIFERHGDSGHGGDWGAVCLYRDGEGMPSLPLQLPAQAMKFDETMLCIPEVPTYVRPSSFLEFVGEKARPEISHVRMVVTGLNTYLVLIQFWDGAFARKWRGAMDGREFGMGEPETCNIVFLKSITFRTESGTLQNISFPELSYDPFKPPADLPTCPVCLEHMDDPGGRVTILCQHVFHTSCLHQWRESSCPVCRSTNPALSSFTYDPLQVPFGSSEEKKCSVCDSGEDLWICLICGNMGCGRYKGAHQKEHYRETGHNVAQEVETSYVWDYAGDTWIHRALRGKPDEKIMDSPASRAPASSSSEESDLQVSNGREKMVTTAHLEATVAACERKFNAIIEQQRLFSESILQQMEGLKQEVQTASDDAARAKLAHTTLQTTLSETQTALLTQQSQTQSLERDLARSNAKLDKATALAKAMTRSFQEEKKLGEGLLENVRLAREKLEERDREVEGLKEELRDAYAAVEMRERLGEMGLEEGELESAGLEVVDGGGGGGKKGRRRRK